MTFLDTQAPGVACKGDGAALRVAVCEYYVHGECVDFAAADCKENATYCAGSEPRHVHHWREGNLPANSKCAACRRACWSAECLTGYRCEWCGSTVSRPPHL